MKLASGVIVFSTILATIYGVVFSKAYPSVETSPGIVTLCALLGLATCIALAGLWKVVAKGRSGG